MTDANGKRAQPARQQFNIYLPPALIRRLKYRALDEQTSLSELVERALGQFLDQPSVHKDEADHA